MFTLIFSVFAAYVGVGALLVHDTDFKPTRPGLPGQLVVTASALMLALIWPKFAVIYGRQFLRDLL